MVAILYQARHSSGYRLDPRRLEITIAANVGPDLTLHNTLNLGAGSVADIARWYLIGEIIGALFFQTLCWAVIVFFASAGASAGYLTASEVFPLEVRAKAIAVFFAIAQCFGAFGSAWYGHLIGTGQDRNTLFAGYVVGAVAMILGGLTAVFFAVDAEGKSLEDVATPLSVIAKPSQAIFRSGGDRGSGEGQPAS